MTMQLASDEWLARYEEQQRRCAALQPGVDAHNKAVLLGALAAASVTRVQIDFDGYGDEGQVESVAYTGADGSEVEQPIASVQLESVLGDGSGTIIKDLTLGEAVEEFCFDLLGSHHGGWENNDGAYGDFAFDVENGTITYTHNSRYTEVDTSVHTL